jgi:hypothetical protein
VLSPLEIEMIQSEIERLKYARERCMDSGILKLLDRWIEEQKTKLELQSDKNGLLDKP